MFYFYIVSFGTKLVCFLDVLKKPVGFCSSCCILFFTCLLFLLSSYRYSVFNLSGLKKTLQRADEGGVRAEPGVGSKLRCRGVHPCRRATVHPPQGEVSSEFSPASAVVASNTLKLQKNVLE